MPDPEPCPCSWMDKAKAIVLVIGAVAGLIASTTAAIFGGLNHSQTGVIRDHQIVNSEKIDAAAAEAVEVKKELMTQNATVAKTAEKVEEVHKAVQGKKQ